MRPHSFGVTTGRAEVRACSRCDRPVEHSELVYGVPNAPNASLWVPARHNAPCGLQCCVWNSPETPVLLVPVHLSLVCPTCADIRVKARDEGRALQ